MPYLRELLLDNHSLNASLSDGRSIEEDYCRNQDDRSTDNVDTSTDDSDTTTDNGDTLQEDGTRKLIQAETDTFVTIGSMPSTPEEELRPSRCPVNDCTKAYKSQIGPSCHNHVRPKS